jgi:hypothetical protein
VSVLQQPMLPLAVSGVYKKCLQRCCVLTDGKEGFLLNCIPSRQGGGHLLMQLLAYFTEQKKNYQIVSCIAARWFTVFQ